MSDPRDLVEVASFQQLIEADIFSGRLQSEGIEAFVQDAYSVSLWPHRAQALGGIKVQVMRKDLEAARAVFAEARKEEVAAQGDPCPSCSGTNTRLVRRYSWKALLNVITFPINFSIYRKSYRCGDCGREWQKV